VCVGQLAFLQTLEVSSDQPGVKKQDKLIHTRVVERDVKVRVTQ
jgi:hypothetical protein